MNHRKRKWISSLVISICLLAIAIASYLSHINYELQENSSNLAKKDNSYGSVMNTDNKKQLYSGKDVLILVPHEDDEVLLCGGMIEEYIHYGSVVTIAFMTNGDYDGTADIRFQEAKKVAHQYGIDDSHIILFGYGDQYRDASGDINSLGSIYTAKPDEVVMSHIGNTATYGSDGLQPYRNESYTRNHLQQDIADYIKEAKPDTIFVSDYDNHPDHRTLSMIFEKAMGDVLKSNQNYQPQIYKGFCYFGGWNGDYDFYEGDQLLSVQYGGTNMLDDPVYLWKDRIRFPLCETAVTRNLVANSTYQALSTYASQNATDHAIEAMDSDQIFWQRRSDNELLGAVVHATSSNPEVLNDFQLFDTDALLQTGLLPQDSANQGLWQPDANDDKKTVTMTLPEEKPVRYLDLYDSVSLTDNILNAKITLDQGQVIETGPLDKTGAKTEIDLKKNYPVKEITIQILSFEGTPGCMEVEAYSSKKQKTSDIVKLTDVNGNFLYDAAVSADHTLDLKVYDSQSDTNTVEDIASTYDVELKDCAKGSVKIDKNIIHLSCNNTEKGVLLLKKKGSDTVVDAISVRGRLSWLDKLDRKVIKHLQNNWSAK